MTYKNQFDMIKKDWYKDTINNQKVIENGIDVFIPINPVGFCNNYCYSKDTFLKIIDCDPIYKYQITWDCLNNIKRVSWKEKDCPPPYEKTKPWYKF